MNFTSIILAGWHGTRMRQETEKFWVPKHLLPLWNNETPVGRLARQLRADSDRIICLVRPGQEELFKEHVPDVEIISSLPDWVPFLDSLNALKKKTQITSDQVLLTTGDLVFEDQVIRNAISTLHNPLCTHLFTQKWKHWHRIHVRFFCTPTKKIEQILASPPKSEKVQHIFLPLIHTYGLDFLRGRIKRTNIQLIANLNKPEDVQLAREKLQTQK